MKRQLLFLIFLLSSTLLSAQVVRSGVVRRTTNVVKLEEKEKEKPVYSTPYGHEIGRLTHFVGGGIGADSVSLTLSLDYALQYRWSESLSAGVGVSGGYSSVYDDKFGINLRANIKYHILAKSQPTNLLQPFVALWLEYAIPYAEHSYYPEFKEYGSYPLGGTIEIGADLYKYKYPMYLSLNLYLRQAYEFYSTSMAEDKEGIVVAPSVRVGIKF